jgi:hypothetical protein
MAHSTDLFGAHMLQGICCGRAGLFPATYVRDLHPPSIPRLESPFDSVKAKESSKEAKGETEWGSTRVQEPKASQLAKKAFVSNVDDEEGEEGDDASLVDKETAHHPVPW